jgi:hypothetical protein
MATKPSPIGRLSSISLAFCLIASATQLVGATEFHEESINGEGGKRDGLIIWVFPNDRTGIQIALHELKEARKDLKVKFEIISTETQCKARPAEPVSIWEALQNISKDAPAHLKVKISPNEESKKAQGDEPTNKHTEAQKHQEKYLVFKFCPRGKLFDLWKPLYRRLAWELVCRPVCTNMDLWQMPLCRTSEPWLKEFSEDIEADQKPQSERVVILGPDESDSVPALLFALRHGMTKGATYPLIFNVAATSSLLEEAKLAELEKPDDLRLSSTPPNWQTSLGRMMGYCEDDFVHATDDQRAEIWKVLKAISDPAKSFIMFPDSDQLLVKSSIAYLYTVEGLSKIGIIYPDQQRLRNAMESTNPNSPNGFDLRLMSWGDGTKVPTSGKHLIVVGTDNNNLLHIRIFDQDEKPVTDTDETKLTPAQSQAILTLKQRLPGLLPPHVLTDEEKAQIRKEVTSIVGQTRPNSRLYGLTLRDEYQFQLENAPRMPFDLQPKSFFFSAPFFKTPTEENRSNRDIRDHLLTWLGVGPTLAKESTLEGDQGSNTLSPEVAERLRLTLRFFRQSGVQAVGVFGEITDKLPILALARKELPNAQLFTVDANWKLESPPSAPVGGQSPDKPIQAAAVLEGLLVFSNSSADRSWVEKQFVELSALNGKDSCLPDIFQYATHHLVKKLVEFAREGCFEKLTSKEVKRDRVKRDRLIDEIREKSTILREQSLCSGRKMEHNNVDVMIIRNGALEMLSDPNDWLLAIGLVAIGLVTVILVRLAAQRTRVHATSRREIVPISPLYYIYYIYNLARRLLGWLARELLVWDARRSPDVNAADAETETKLRWERLTNPETLFTSLGLCGFLVVVILTFQLDNTLAHWFHWPVRSASWAVWPDGHSVLPSIFLAGIAGLIAHHLPYRFEVGLRRQGLLTLDPVAQFVGQDAMTDSGSPPPADSWVLRTRDSES